MTERLSILIPTSLKTRIDNLKKKMHLDQSSLIRILINQAIEENELDLAIAEYQKGRITLGEAVLMAHTDYWTLIDLLHDRGIAANIDSDDHAAEIESIRNKDYQKYLKK